MIKFCIGQEEFSSYEELASYIYKTVPPGKSVQHCWLKDETDQKGHSFSLSRGRSVIGLQCNPWYEEECLVQRPLSKSLGWMADYFGNLDEKFITTPEGEVVKLKVRFAGFKPWQAREWLEQQPPPPRPSRWTRLKAWFKKRGQLA